MADRNFNGLARRFARNIYGTRKGAIRLAVLQRDLARIVNDEPIDILDAGGGQGQFSCQLAALGHRITLCDISSDMLNMAEENAAQMGVAEQLTLLERSIQSHAMSGIRYPLVLCHAVMEWVDEPWLLLAALRRLMTDEGTLSLMFYNVDGQRFHHLHHGNFDFVERDMPAKGTLQPLHPLSLEQVLSGMAQQGLEPVSISGVRVLNDYLDKKVLADQAQQQLLAAELRWSQHPAYYAFGTIFAHRGP